MRAGAPASEQQPAIRRQLEAKEVMNPILEMLMNAGGGGAVQQLSRQFGLSEDQTQGALGQLVPAVMAGLQQNTASEGGMGALLGALTNGHHSQYLDNPELLGQQSTVAEGNGILGHIFGRRSQSFRCGTGCAADWHPERCFEADASDRRDDGDGQFEQEHSGSRSAVRRRIPDIAT